MSVSTSYKDFVAHHKEDMTGFTGMFRASSRVGTTFYALKDVIVRLCE